MTFLCDWLDAHLDRPCLTSEAREYTYREVSQITSPQNSLFKRGQVCLLGFGFSCDHILIYLEMVRAGAIPLLMPYDSSKETLETFVKNFKPAWLVGFSSEEAMRSLGKMSDEKSGLSLFFCDSPGVRIVPHPDLALLIPTSGSTGDSKVVRLSHSSVKFCSEAIAKVLGLFCDDVSVTSLPLFYSYGLSVLHAQLASGGSIYVCRPNLLDKNFWATLKRARVSHFAAVPSMYSMILAAKLEKLIPKSFRVLTCAGGKLSIDRTRELLKLSKLRGFAYFSMYGATEASPRISIVPPEFAATKLGSAGIPIPGTSLKTRPKEGWDETEVICCGPNIAMGYAQTKVDLSVGDTFCGQFFTGDCGYIDEDGYLYLTGRLKRFAKANGISVNLDQFTSLIQVGTNSIATLGYDDFVVVAIVDESDKRVVMKNIARYTAVPISAVRIMKVDTLPLLDSGKPDYKALEKMWREIYAR